jgi:hypothetical protein
LRPATVRQSTRKIAVIAPPGAGDDCYIGELHWCLNESNWRNRAIAPLLRYVRMRKILDPETAEELQELYTELHLTCERAATALRLSANWDASSDELLDRFRREEAHAAAIWKRISEIQGF